VKYVGTECLLQMVDLSRSSNRVDNQGAPSRSVHHGAARCLCDPPALSLPIETFTQNLETIPNQGLRMHVVLLFKDGSRAYEPRFEATLQPGSESCLSGPYGSRDDDHEPRW
jgi:hypothetical protein